MKYLGGKSRFAKEILQLIPPATNFVEPFVGGGNITKNIPRNKYQNIICSDINPYLIAYYKAIQQGWQPKTNYTEQEYYDMQKDFRQDLNQYPKHELAYVGFSYSYMAAFFKCFARNKRNSDYAGAAYRQFLNDKIWTQYAQFFHCNYHDLPIPPNSVVYCDPPYNIPYTNSGYNSKATSGKFDHKIFWDWVRSKVPHYPIFISEQSAPDDFIPIWQKERKTTGRLKTNIAIEKLFVHISYPNYYPLPKNLTPKSTLTLFP